MEDLRFDSLELEAFQVKHLQGQYVMRAPGAAVAVVLRCAIVRFLPANM